MIDAEPTIRPLFVLGNPRSGTTMFRLMLTAHPQVCIPPESPFVVQYFRKYGRTSDWSLENLRRIADDVISGADLERRWEIGLDSYVEFAQQQEVIDYASFCRSLYLFYARARGKSGLLYWGDKNNSYRNYVHIIGDLFPDAVFVHLLRDSRAVFASYQALPKRSSEYSPVLPKGAPEFCAQWNATLASVDRYCGVEPGPQFYFLKYEDLVSEFDEAMAALCQHLGMELHEDMRDFHALNRKQNLEPAAYDGWKWRTKEPITTSRIDKWKTSLLPQDIAIIEALTGVNLVRFGYELSQPDNGESVPIKSRLTYAAESALARARAVAREIRYRRM